MIFNRNKLYQVITVKDHSKYKKKILDTISNNTECNYVAINTETKNSHISNTDWMNSKINWFNQSFSNRDRKQIFDFIEKKYNKKVNVYNCWFNQYYANSGSEHPTHNHPELFLTCIYYVELSDNNLNTILINPKNSKEVIPRVKEGNVLIFPGEIYHRSPRNIFNSRKTVVVFNLSVIGD